MATERSRAGDKGGGGESLYDSGTSDGDPAPASLASSATAAAAARTAWRPGEAVWPGVW